MRGTITALTADGGTIYSSTQVSCPYTFTRDQYMSDWDDLVEDFAEGAVISVVFARREQGIAYTVRRRQ